jgi:mannose-1-phosphate guanylyltransferase
VGVQGEKVVSFTPEQDLSTLAFTGIHVVDAGVLEMIPGHQFFHIIDLYRELAAKGRVGLLRVDGAFWRDIGTPEDYLQLHRELLADGAGTDCTWSGQRQDGWLLGAGVQAGKNVQFNDWGVVGNQVWLGDLVTLERSVVWDKVQIPAGSHIIDSIVTGETV